MSELQPCPMCVGKAEAFNTILEGYVQCWGCHLVVIRKNDHLGLGGTAKAIAAWNTRAQPAATGERAVKHPPEYIHEWTDDDYDKGRQIGMDDRDEEWRDALAAAGIKCE